MTTIKELEKRVKEAQKNGTVKVNISHDGENEGIWACPCTPEDAKIYEKNTHGEAFQCFLMNHALIGGPSWGARLTVKTNGDMRPIIPVEDVLKQMNEAVAAGDYPPAEDFK